MRIFFSTEINNLRANLPSTGIYRDNPPLPYHPIIDFVDNSLHEINLSIINGKYIIEDIEAICLAINLEIDAFEIDFPHFINLKKYLDVIREGLNKYSNFYENIKNIYGLKVINFISFSRSRRFSFQSKLKLLEINIKLNLIDNNFTSQRDILIKLFTIKNELENILLHGNFSDIHNALQVKVNFLIYKWYLRTAQKEGNIEYSSILRDLRRQIPSGIFDVWIQKMLNHYEIPGEDWRGYFHQINTTISHDNTNLTFLEINNKIKYQKDVIKNEEELKKIVNDIEIRVNNITGLSELEEVSYSLLLNYAINNYFSLFCHKQYEKFEFLKLKGDKKIIEKCKIIINDIVHKYNELISKLKGKTNNFFIDYKFTLFSIKILNEAYDLCLDKALFIETFTDDVNTNINNVLTNYKKKKEWSLLNNNYIFKLDFSSSLLNHNNIDVYYASSFTLAKINDDVEERFEEVYNLFKDLKLRFILKYEIETIHSLTDEFKKENKRIIEVVTLFTAIFAFIVGSIGALDFIKTFRQSLIFMLCFGVAISIFVMLMYIANSKLNKYREHAGKRKIDIFKNSTTTYSLEYPIVNYRILRNSLFLIIIYGFIFFLMFFLFKYDTKIGFKSLLPIDTKEAKLQKQKSSKEQKDQKNHPTFAGWHN